MKPFGYTINILKDTNKVIGCSETDFSGIREGSYIRFGNDTLYYQVSKPRKFFYIKDFKIEDNPKKLIITGNIGINLIKNDILNISYKEYGLSLLLGLRNGGTKYKVDDEIIIPGKSSYDVASGHSQVTTFVVHEVNAEGSITQIGLKEPGKYITAPESVVEVAGGNGVGAVLEVQYDLLERRAQIERTITNITFDNDKSILWLDYNMPTNIQDGKLSLEKWEILLTSNYLGESKLNETFEVVRDSTPNLKLPLFLRGSVVLEPLLNHSLTTIDSKIKELENRIKELEDKTIQNP